MDLPSIIPVDHHPSEKLHRRCSNLNPIFEIHDGSDSNFESHDSSSNANLEIRETDSKPKTDEMLQTSNQPKTLKYTKSMPNLNPGTEFYKK